MIIITIVAVEGWARHGAPSHVAPCRMDNGMDLRGPHPIRWHTVTQDDAFDQSREFLRGVGCVHANMERVSEEQPQISSGTGA
jgi:hypothetical protein